LRGEGLSIWNKSAAAAISNASNGISPEIRPAQGYDGEAPEGMGIVVCVPQHLRQGIVAKVIQSNLACP